MGDDRKYVEIEDSAKFISVYLPDSHVTLNFTCVFDGRFCYLRGKFNLYAIEDVIYVHLCVFARFVLNLDASPNICSISWIALTFVSRV